MPLDSAACMCSRSEAPEEDIVPLSLVSADGRFLDPWNRFVAMIPGHSPVAPTFAPAAFRSAASTSVMARIACLQIPYMLPAAITEVIEQVLTTCPGSPCASIRGTNVLMPEITDIRLTDSVPSQSLA